VRVRAAAKQVEPCSLRLEDAVAKAGAENEPQIEILELVVFIVVEEVPEQAGIEISVVGPPASDRLGGGIGLAVNRAVE